MNTNWIYDLDFTLYQINSEQDFDYNLLNYNPNLNNNIKSLKGKKSIIYKRKFITYYYLV